MSSDTPDIASNLRLLRQRCKMGALDRSELKEFFVETDEGRDPQSGLRHILKQQLEDAEGNARLLVYGHGGCGKSTELVKLVEEIEESFFCVSFSVQDKMALTDIRAEDIILVMMEQLMESAQESNLKVKDSDLKPIFEFFMETTRTDENSREKSASAKAGAKGGIPVFAPLFSLLAELSAEVKYSARSQETRVSKVRTRPNELLAHVQVLINSVANALPKGKKLLIIVEDLDKLDIACAHEVFIKNANILAGVAGNIIYTIPIFTFHSNEAGTLRRRFDGDIALPMIKTLEMDGKTHAAGFDIVKTIIHRRVDSSVIEEGALDLLVEKTGGVLQHVFEVLHTAASMSNATVPLAKKNIEYGLARKRNEFWQEIALPLDASKELAETALYDRLEEYAREQQAGKKTQPTTDEVNQILLKSCALVEYNTQRWLGVHPLVKDNLRELGRL